MPNWIALLAVIIVCLGMAWFVYEIINAYKYQPDEHEELTNASDNENDMHIV